MLVVERTLGLGIVYCWGLESLAGVDLPCSVSVSDSDPGHFLQPHRGQCLNLLCSGRFQSAHKSIV